MESIVSGIDGTFVIGVSNYIEDVYKLSLYFLSSLNTSHSCKYLFILHMKTLLLLSFTRIHTPYISNNTTDLRALDPLLKHTLFQCCTFKMKTLVHFLQERFSFVLTYFSNVVQFHFTEQPVLLNIVSYKLLPFEIQQIL